MKQVTDVVISGGGPVGLILALVLAQYGRRSCVIEPSPMQPSAKAQGSFDGRVLALSEASVKTLKRAQVWEALAPVVTAIEHVHVSQKGYMGLTKLHAHEVGVAALGYSIRGQDLGAGLWQAVRQQPLIEVIAGRVTGFEQDENVITTQVQAKETLVPIESQLLVGADGTQSQVRQSMGLALEQKNYHAYGVLAQVRTAQPHQGWSFERFTQEGPVALLPIGKDLHKAVMVVPEAQLESVMALSDKEYITAFTEKMGARFGGYVEVSERLSYPLTEAYVEHITQGRALLMGNAAHTQHPVAAQGLNLGIADIADFMSVFEAQLESKQALFDPERMQTYQQQRSAHHQKVMGMTDSLISLFQHSSPMLGHLRGIGLMAMQAMPGLRKRFTKFGMGRRAK